jgi:hypothetical protein
MTSMRAVAYRRVMKALCGIGAPEVWPAEQERVREAADALLFCRDLDEADVRHAVAAAAVQTDDLVDAERWTPRRARQLLDDIWACGAHVAADVPMAASRGRPSAAVSVQGAGSRPRQAFRLRLGCQSEADR